MLDINTLPEYVLDSLQKRGHNEEDIANMTPKQAFTEYCNWHGLINWGDDLWEVRDSLAASCVSKAPLGES